jgi:chromosome segregation ATPase
MNIGGKKMPQVDPDKKKQLEQAAIAQINEATLAGMKKGEEASRKLHQDAKSQTEEQTTEAIGKLKDKFDSTRGQVMQIVHNFGSIRSELDDIKQEFLQQESAIVDKNSNLLQLNSEESENQLASIQERLVSKER